MLARAPAAWSAVSEGRVKILILFYYCSVSQWRVSFCPGFLLSFVVKISRAGCAAAGRDCMIVHRKCQIILHERNLQINAKEDLFPISPISQLSAALFPSASAT